jgi:hypothetical protein
MPRPGFEGPAGNLDNFLRTLATPEPIKDWSLTSLKEKLIKIGAKVVSQPTLRGLHHFQIQIRFALRHWRQENDVRVIFACHVYIAEDEILKAAGLTYEIAYRHEIGHCNGWPADHPGARPAGAKPGKPPVTAEAPR